MKKITLTKLDGTKVERTLEVPKYGGTFRMGVNRPPLSWDDAFNKNPSLGWNLKMVHDELLEGDWARGSQGTKEAEWQIRGTLFLQYSRNSLATDWEIKPEENKFVFKIRQGVYFQNKPPVNGREMTAEDVAMSINRMFRSMMCGHGTSFGKYFVEARVTEPWTVEVEVNDRLGDMFKQTADYLHIMSKEIMEAGDQREWQNVIGTGPFQVVDFVAGSSITYVRHDNYWDVNPLFPENKLPYLDGIKYLIIPDWSTMIASLRTAKIDWVMAIDWENRASLKQTNPELQEFKFLQAAHLNVIYFRTDKPELPFDDIRVRQALCMAVDKEAIKNDYYGGNAELFSCPVAPYAEFMHFFIPLEEYPEEAQMLYTYNPEKAKQLLAEAGYPNGFKTNMVLREAQVNIASLVAAYWADIGVDVELDVKEYGVYYSIIYARSHSECAYYAISTVAPHYISAWRNDSYFNLSMADDPKVQAAYEVISNNVVVNDAVADQALKELYPYAVSQAWYLETPSPYLYTMWQPWIKGYGGETTIGVSDRYGFPKYIWCDQDLKEEMTGRR